MGNFIFLEFGMDKIQKAFELFDACNRLDPVQIIWNGEAYPKEYFFAQRLYEWVNKLVPVPSKALLLASRSQHIGRWEISRNSYPEGRVGYLRWRADLARFHADKAGALMAEAGFGQDEIERVQYIILKKGLKTDPEVQAIEDALCLVFLQFEYNDFLLKHEEEKIIRILRKTWSKMSEKGRESALALTFSTQGQLLMEKALNAG